MCESESLSVSLPSIIYPLTLYLFVAWACLRVDGRTPWPFASSLSAAKSKFWVPFLEETLWNWPLISIIEEAYTVFYFDCTCLWYFLKLSMTFFCINSFISLPASGWSSLGCFRPSITYGTFRFESSLLTGCPSFLGWSKLFSSISIKSEGFLTLLPLLDF